MLESVQAHACNFFPALKVNASRITVTVVRGPSNNKKAVNKPNDYESQKGNS